MPCGYGEELGDSDDSLKDSDYEQPDSESESSEDDRRVGGRQQQTEQAKPSPHLNAGESIY